MKTLILKNNIRVYCKTADTFPNGVQQAHQDLHALFQYDKKRKYFGLSWEGPNGMIIYKAAAAELNKGEISGHHLETKIIEKGEYLYLDVPNFMNHIPDIEAAFKKLIHNEAASPDGFCIEWYIDQTLCRCMIKQK